MSKPDGGNAFPLMVDPSAGTDVRNRASGMSLRDYFAAAALPLIDETFGGMNRLPHLTTATVAVLAYEVADAMLAERAK